MGMCRRGIDTLLMVGRKWCVRARAEGHWGSGRTTRTLQVASRARDSPHTVTDPDSHRRGSTSSMLTATALGGDGAAAPAGRTHCDVGGRTLVPSAERRCAVAEERGAGAHDTALRNPFREWRDGRGKRIPRSYVPAMNGPRGCCWRATSSLSAYHDIFPHKVWGTGFRFSHVRRTWRIDSGSKRCNIVSAVSNTKPR